MTTSVLNALTALSPISADAKEKKLAQRARAERLYQETGDALNKVVDFLDRTLARIEVA